MMAKPEDIPQDVWEYAAAAERVWRGLRVDTDRIEAHARQLLSERARDERLSIVPPPSKDRE